MSLSNGTMRRERAAGGLLLSLGEVRRMTHDGGTTTLSKGSFASIKRRGLRQFCALAAIVSAARSVQVWGWGSCWGFISGFPEIPTPCASQPIYRTR